MTTNYIDSTSYPYFMTAWNTPIAGNVSFQGAQQYQTVPAQEVQQAQPVPQQVADTNFAVDTSASNQIMAQQPQQKKSYGWLWALGIGAAVVGTVAYLGYKKGDGEGVKRIWDGCKKMWQGVESKVTGNSSAKESFKIIKQGGKKGSVVCEVPGARNVLRSSDRSLTSTVLQELGLNGNTVALGEKGTEFMTGKFTIKGTSYIVTQSGNGELKLSTITGKTIKTLKNPSKAVKEAAEQISKGQFDKLANGVTVGDYAYRLTEGTTTKKIVANGIKGTSHVGTVRTNRFTLDSPAVRAYRYNHPEIDESLKVIAKNKIPDSANIDKAIYKLDNTHNLIFENGKLKGIEITTGAGKKTKTVTSLVGERTFNDYMYTHNLDVDKFDIPKIKRDRKFSILSYTL